MKRKHIASLHSNEEQSSYKGGILKNLMGGIAQSSYMGAISKL